MELGKISKARKGNRSRRLLNRRMESSDRSHSGRSHHSFPGNPSSSPYTYGEGIGRRRKGWSKKEGKIGRVGKERKEESLDRKRRGGREETKRKRRGERKEEEVEEEKVEEEEKKEEKDWKRKEKNEIVEEMKGK